MNKTLVIQTAFIGDVILATPVLEALKQNYPGSQVDILVRKGNESLLANNPAINEVLIWDKKQGKYKDLWRLLQVIRSKKYQKVINLQRFGATGLLTAFSKAKEKIGFAKNPFSFLFTGSYPHELGRQKDSPHEVDRNLSLLELNERIRPKLFPGKGDYEAINQYTTSQYICIAPASVWFTKQFPIEKWVDFLNQKEVAKYQVFLVGGPDDRFFCQSIIEKTDHTNISNLSGELSLLETAALMEGAKMNYSNDSAPLHIASAMNAPLTAIFCSTLPEFGFGPLSNNSHVVEIREDLYCRSCTNHGKKACPEGHFRCAYDIEVGELVETLEKG